jgi:hypothetical protein
VVVLEGVVGWGLGEVRVCDEEESGGWWVSGLQVNKAN